MKKILLSVLLLLPIVTNAQDCSGKIKAAQASKEIGNYRLALAQFTAAASSCGEGRRVEIEKEILDIYDKIEKLKDEAVSAKNFAKIEEEKAKASAEVAADALESVQQANLKAQAAYDSLKVVLDNLGRANSDKVSLILAEVKRNQQELDFKAAMDNIKTAKILNALPDSVNLAYQSLSKNLLLHAQKNLLGMDYKLALEKIKSARELNVQMDTVEAAMEALRHFLLENIFLDLKNTNYSAAVEKTNALNTIEISLDTVISLYFESAFCFTEVGRLNRAAGLLDTIAQLRNSPTVRPMLMELTGKEPSEKIQELHKIMQLLDPQRNKNLLAKYFPPLTVRIPKGTLTMGSASEDKTNYTCQITTNSFLLGEKEVTFFEYDLFCAATNRQKPTDNGWGRGARPVIDVDWFNAAEFCNWRSRQEGLQEVYVIDMESKVKVTCNWSAKGYRLPTETEWEFAAGNGEKHTRYSWGNAPPSGQQGGNVTDETAKAKFPNWEIFKGYTDGFAYTAITGSYQPNDFGLYDMTGNVWEWCWDWYDENYCLANKNKNTPQGPGSGAEKVLRGGSWGSFPKDCLVINRFYNMPNTRNYSIGFRLARN